MLRPHASKLIARCVKMALGGDSTAMRICMDRLVAPVREEAVNVELPPIGNIEDCGAAQAAVIAVVAAGDMLPSQAQVLCALIEAQRRSFETTDILKRLTTLEESLQQRAGSR